jgi:hypothetical protein
MRNHEMQNALTVGVVGNRRQTTMARKYSSGASKKVEKAMHERKEGTLKSGRSGKTVKSRKQAIGPDA